MDLELKPKQNIANSVHSISTDTLSKGKTAAVVVVDELDHATSRESVETTNSTSGTTTTTTHRVLKTCRQVLLKYIRFIGPGLLISVAYIDPGNYSSAVTAGASNQFSLLCITLFSNIIAIFLQCLCIRLGSVTGLDFSRACRAYLPRWMNWTLYIFAECTIIATDVAEVIGTAIALNILIKVPLPAGVVISIVDVLFVMYTYRPGNSSMRFVRLFEYGVALLVLAVVICFAVELAYIPSDTSVRKVFRGFVPSKQMFDNDGMYTAISILGATVMPHSLFLGSALVQPRLLEYDVAKGNYTNLEEEEEEVLDKRTKEIKREEKYFNYRPSLDAINYCMKYSMIEVSLTLFTFALFVNAAILIVAGATLYGSEKAEQADLYDIHDLLSQTLAPAAGTIFMLALLLSGQSAGIVCTMAGQVVCEGHIKWKMAPWQRRLFTRAISIIPCLIVSICIGRSALAKTLNASQVVLSIALPFLVAPLIYFTCKKSIMHTEVTVPPDEHDDSTSKHADISKLEDAPKTKTVYLANHWTVAVLGVLVWIFLTILNVYAIVQLGLSHGNIS